MLYLLYFKINIMCLCEMLVEQVVIVCSGLLQQQLFRFCFLSLSLSNLFFGAQPHSHSSSLSSVELISASDDIHRFSTQVLYFVNREYLCLQPDAELHTAFSPQSENAWECLLTSLSRIWDNPCSFSPLIIVGVYTHVYRSIVWFDALKN